MYVDPIGLGSPLYAPDSFYTGAGFLTLLLLSTPNYAMEESSAVALIPMRLSQRERGVYEKLIRVVEKRKKENGLRPQLIVVITDVGKDYDDLAALVVLTEFHRLGLVELRAVVANLMPARKRARFARAVLDSLGLPHVPVACGTPGSPEDHEEFKHELEGNEVEYSGGGSATPKDVPMEEGHDLLLKVYKNAQEKDEKLHLLCLSSLQDIHEFASTHEDLVKECTADVHMQGGNHITDAGQLEPDRKAANNRFNLDAAKEWHSFIQKVPEIPSHTYTKSAAFTAPLTSDVFVKLEETGHRVGAYLRRVQVEQDLAFYKRACESDPEKRFAPFMDQKWFLANKTDWNQRPDASNEDALPTGEEVIPYLTKIVLYDVHAALGIAGCDVVKELNVDESRNRKDVNHSITDDKLSLTHKDDIFLTVSSLLKGSLNFHAKVGVSK